MDILSKLKGLGYETIPEEYYKRVEDWSSWYEGNVRGFHNYRMRNGHGVVNRQRSTLNMAKKVSEDWANLLMNERVKITIEGDKEQEFVDDILKKNSFEIKANEMQELKMALGTVAFVPRVVGQSEDGASEIKIDYVTINNIFPLRWDNGKVVDCAFTSKHTVNGKDYIYLQIHKKEENGNYVIENSIYSYENDSLSDAKLEDVEGFEKVIPVVHTNSKERQFVIDRPNIANNVNYHLPVGIPVYANAIDVLKGIDVAYDSYCNEFLLGKKRIMVSPTAEKYIDGEPVFDPTDVSYYVLPEELKDGSVITPIDMTLRTVEHNRGIQDQLNLLSSKCGFGEQHYKFDGGSVATATQIVSENSTLFRSIKKHEIILDEVIKELCAILLRLGNTAMNAGVSEDVEITIDFDDSIIEDKATEFSRDMQLLQAGIMNAWEFRAKWMNEDEETAKKNLPSMEAMVEEQQEEVE